MNIIGLGTCGCAIADEFSKYNQYKIFKLDSDIKNTKNSFCLKRFDKPEDYELNPPDLRKFFIKIKGEILLILGGSGMMSNYTLVVLEQLKHLKINVLYVYPDVNFLAFQNKLLNRMCFSVLQELARSGVLNRIYLVSNSNIEEILGGLPIVGFNEKLNDMITSSFHMYFSFKKSKPVTSTSSELPIAARISTIGLVDLDTKEEKFFFPLDNVTDIEYYLAYNEKDLQSNSELIKTIKSFILNKKEGSNLRISYGVYETNYEQSYGFSASHTSVIQG